MYIPSKFKETNLDKLHSFILEFPLATLVSSIGDSIDVDHIPFYLKEREGGQVTLQSHIARANSLWKNCSDGQDVLLIFHGPNAYVSPSFYPSKKETGKVVPTWNYCVVHVKGRVHFKHEGAWILQLLNDISDAHELGQNVPWSVSDAPASFTEKLLEAVVGLEVEFDNIVGNFKLSQNKSAADYSGVLQSLLNSESSAGAEVAKQMQACARKEIIP